jgi:7-keto-8-aminopelargonate synthetase-like enzyme
MEISKSQKQLLELFQKVDEIGVNYLQVEDESLNDEFITVKGKKLYNFGNCGYLALEQDKRIKSSTIEYVERYGAFFCTSRSFASLKILADTESLLEKIFDRPVLLANTTGLCHIAAIPLLASRRDLIISDKQVHRTVANAVLMAKGQGTSTENLNHNDLVALEQKLIAYADKYEKIWYMADSIYSMFGDAAPLKELRLLLDKYPNFYLYIDDAHGTGWSGKNGAGYLRSQIEYHEKLVVATSLQKGFGAFGAVLLMPNEEMKEMVKYLGSIFIFSGPPTPATIGGITACAKIHLSPEIYELQRRLSNIMEHFVETCKRLNVPLVSRGISPVFFIGIGVTELTIEIARKLIDDGFFINTCAYPAVPVGNAGIRITLSLHHSLEGVTKLIEAISNRIKEAQLDTDEVLSKFKITRQLETIA